jgi:phosphatidylinositol alpha-mannosyltransferase
MTPSTSMFATLAAASPVVATFHSGASRALLFDIAAPVLRRVARRISVRIAVSRAAEAFASRRLGDGFRIVPNGADVERFGRAAPAALSPGRRILFVGRLDPRKGFRVAVEALRLLAAQYGDVRLVAAGDGPERSAVEELPTQVRSRVDLLGTVRNADLPPFLAAADVVVAPSIGGESFGMVLVEAMAAGVPVVASRIPGYDEVVRDGVDGLLVPAGDPRALAAGVRLLLEDGNLARRLADSGRARARGFSWDVVLDQIEAAYGDARPA